MNDIRKVGNEGKIIESKPLPIVSGIVDYCFLGYSVFAMISLMSTIIKRNVVNNTITSLGITFFIIVGVIIYYLYIADKVKFLSIGELCTGRKLVEGNKKWTNPKGKSRELDFAILLFVFILYVNAWDGMATGKIFTLLEIGVNILFYIGIVIIAIYSGQKIRKGINELIEKKEELIGETNDTRSSILSNFVRSIINPADRITLFISNTRVGHGIVIGIVSLTLLDVSQLITSRVSQGIGIADLSNTSLDIIWKGVTVLLVNSLIMWIMIKLFKGKMSFIETLSKIGYTWMMPAFLSIIMIPLGFITSMGQKNPESQLSILIIIYIFMLLFGVFLHFRFLINYYERIFNFTRVKTIIFFIVTFILIFFINSSFFFTTTN